MKTKLKIPLLLCQWYILVVYPAKYSLPEKNLILFGITPSMENLSFFLGILLNFCITWLLGKEHGYFSVQNELNLHALNLADKISLLKRPLGPGVVSLWRCLMMHNYHRDCPVLGWVLRALVLSGPSCQMAFEGCALFGCYLLHISNSNRS